ncbi:hypothetical protein NDI85_19655 [Halomicroarcula sp. S1AR25-4]|uniref:hypothetical protein n=1 Tax=Haloarcula sp. S1AR25-4 TaxID=2950538 RepID=UPI0028744B80|nr:hypothetical protein [Halomicroarcula sp. S1AR25-4]MDS0280004.1 hypothetical protein [Halomicroarcula sp. S1AR25-4]
MSARTASVLDAVPTERIERHAPTVERWVAVATVLLYGIGDVVTTYVSEQLGGYESNQLVWGLLHEYGALSLIGHKLVAFAVLAVACLAITALSRLTDGLPPEYRLLALAPKPYEFRVAHLSMYKQELRIVLLSLYAGRGLVLTVSNATVIYQLL